MKTAKKYRALLFLSGILIVLLILIIVLAAIPKSKVTLIPSNDDNYCYDVKALVDEENPEKFKNVTNVLETTTDSINQIKLFVNCHDGTQMELASASNVLVNIAENTTANKIEVFCVSSIDSEEFRLTACEIRIENAGGDIEIYLVRKNLLFRTMDREAKITNFKLQYYIRVQ